VSPWLLRAPPWIADGTQPSAPERISTRKRGWEHVSEAENTLGKLAHSIALRVRSRGWHQVVQELRGQSNITETVGSVPHNAARLLSHLRKRGASVLMRTKPWGHLRCDDAVARGPHKSAQLERTFVLDEILDFCRQGYWTVLPYSEVRDWPSLCISPIGVVPQRDRRPRLIVDYTFSGVNVDTVSLAPKESMQFGRALQRVITKVVHADPRYGPVQMAKIDIADGFYRVWLQIADIPKLGVALPGSSASDPLIAFPLALPMGWIESPPYFTAFTETACDLANNELRHRTRRTRSTVHRLESIAATPAAATVADQIEGEATLQPRLRSHTGRPPLAATDVYVDDFLLLAQTQAQQQRVLRSALHSIDDVFRPLSLTDPATRKEPASVKKMLQGDACWSTFKRILGWDVNTRTETLHLPPHRLDRLYELLALVQPPKRRVSIKLWHKLLGELRSMSPALPGSRGLFSVLQHALVRSDRNRVRLTQHVWDMMADFTAIADSLRQRPTRLRELVPTHPAFLGASDACRTGMGGVWLCPATSHRPIVWRHPFAPTVAAALVTADNPAGSISISDLELSAMIAHKDVLAHATAINERTLWLATDNRAALSWSDKGSSTSLGPRAYLLRFNSLHQRAHRYVALHSHIAGTANSMADDASRLWHLTDDQLLTHFASNFPQASPWQLMTLSPDTNSALTCALFRRRHKPASPLNEWLRPPPPGAHGSLSATALISTPLPCLATPCPSFKSSPNAFATAPSLPAVDVSSLARWRTPSVPLDRRTPGWGPATPG
jgi:hypothetical protein